MPAQYGTPTCRKISTHERMFRNLPSECAPNAGIRPIPNCSSCLTSLNCLNENSTLTSAPCSKLCTDYLISLWHFLILTQAELKVLTDPSCFIDLSPALTTSITRLSLVYSFYMEHRLPVSLVSVMYHILDPMYGCILRISSAILCIPCYLA